MTKLNKEVIKIAKVGEVYKCEVCGNVVSIIEEGPGTLVCCNTDMILLEEQTIEKEGNEKHVPVVEIEGNKVIVKVGNVEHPMEENHFIEMIQLLRNNKLVAEKRLFPNDKPKAEFFIENPDNIRARALCNMHGLWTSK